MQVHVAQADITNLPVDAIVNPANSLGIMGGGVGGIIRRAGGDEIQRSRQWWRYRFFGLDFSHEGSVEFEGVGVVDDAIQDGIGEGPVDRFLSKKAMNIT